ncbi:aldo/keto reductase [Syntrophobotulus glycolicus DSM 8271]|uniref:Aldo/keto reductase n=1 Tax=Syntrophobotulus glycolicus (strain DSM 8271 / FlGlyR) TaxID=645991 RepID=F0T0V2_SYNGF|nr:aldo/keto reductase [Syntrophobotulus glycolicus]ADY56241.1 aldo/keto reductase [Syntrophobotulus glycolicus DSM 8271]
MRKIKLGLLGPEVSEICFGSLAVSPLQGRVSMSEGTEVLRYAVASGIDWVDTAEIYDNYEQIAPVLKENHHVRVVSKSYAVTAEQMDKSIEKARRALGRDMIDFFLLHEQESGLTLKGHAEAWDALRKAKEKGIVNYIGISTHAVRGVRDGALQPGLDIIHPLINYAGLGIIDGTLAEMLAALNFASSLGIGIYAMKVFGGGHLGTDPVKALRFIQKLPTVQAMALGMSSKAEIDYNLMVLAGKEPCPELARSISTIKRKLYIADWCQGCGQCVEKCSQKALYLKKNIAEVIRERCILCGYCGRSCPHFCLKIV